MINFEKTDSNQDPYHKKSNSVAKGDQQRKIKTQQLSQRGVIKARPLGSTNYYALDSDVKSGLNNNNNILVLPPVSSSNNNSNKNTEGNKENKKLLNPKYIMIYLFL